MNNNLYRSLIIGFTLGCLSVLPGCSSITSYFAGEDNSEPPAELTDLASSVEIETVWSTDVGSGSDKHYLKLIPSWWKGNLYTADRDGRLTAVDGTSGKKLWSIDTDTEILGGPGVGDGMALVGTQEGEVLAYSTDDGSLLWKASVSSEVLSAPAIGTDIIVVRTADGKLFGLNKDDGTRNWIYDRTVPVLTLRGTSPPVMAGNAVIAGFDSGKIAAVELSTGRLLWESQIAVAGGRSELERMVDIDATPIIIGATIYVASYQGRVAAVSLESGRMRWARDISSHAGLAVDKRNVYVTDGDSHIWALDRFTGATLWKQEALHARSVTAPATIDDHVVVGDFEGYLHWLQTDDGQIVGREKIDNAAILTPGLSVNHVLYAYSADGKISAMRSH